MSRTAVGTDLENVSRLAAAKTAKEALSTPSTEETASASDIATLAYQLWLERGQPDGDPECDWFEAERLVKLPGAPRETAD